MYLQSVCSYHAQHRLKQHVKNTKSHRLETDIKNILVEYWKKNYFGDSKNLHIQRSLSRNVARQSLHCQVVRVYPIKQYREHGQGPKRAPLQQNGRTLRFSESPGNFRDLVIYPTEVAQTWHVDRARRVSQQKFFRERWQKSVSEVMGK